MSNMTAYEKLPLESALEETPQILALVNLYTEDANYLGEYIKTLHQISSQLVAVHNKLTSTYQDLSKHLKSFSPQKHIPESDPTGELKGGMRKFADIVSEMSTWEHILATQIADGVVYPLSKFIGSELQEVSSLGSLYQASNNEVDRAIGRYSRCRRKDPQQERHEAVEEVYNARKNYHLLALKYYSRLNQLQMGRKVALLQPILGLVTAAKGHHQLGHEALGSSSNDDFLSGIGVTVKGLVEDLQQEREDTEDLVNAMVTQSQLMYYPQPPGELARLPPDTTLSTKSGYLNIHRKYMGVMSSWERQFVYLEGGNLMAAQRCDVAGTLLLELDSSTLAHATDTDDRLHVFTVVTAKKSVTLQALNDRERDEWMLTIQRLAEEGGYVKNEGKLTPSSSFFSGVSQFFSGKLHPSPTAGGEKEPGPSPPATPVTPPLITTPSRSLRGDVIPKDVPIVFDILSIGEESQTSTEARRNAKGSGGSTSEEKDEVDRIYSVRFLGCMGVNVDTGQTVVFEVMRRILAARAIHDMFTTSHLHLTVTATHLTLRDPSSKAVRLQHRLKDVSFWAVHSENQRLVGYIVRQSDSSSGPSSKEGTFSCYVFESDEGGRDICAALGAAARQAYAHLLDQKTREQKRKEETKLLLDNIAKLPDKTSPSETSSDGSALVIERDSRKAEEEEDKEEDNVAEATESSSSKQEKKKLALKYYSRLNQLQMGRKVALLQPILGLVTAAKGHHQLGHEALGSSSNDDFLSGIGVTVKGLVEDLQQEREDTEDLVNAMVTQSQLMYYPQPPGELARLPPDTTLSTKSGYLNIHRKYMGVMSSWERQFVYLEGGNLMAAQRCDVAGTLLLELDSSTLAHATDTDDRLHVFTVVTAKKSVTLQALNDRERDEWMLTIQRLAEEGGYVKNEGKLTPSSSFFSGVSQFFSGKLHPSPTAGGEKEPGPSPPATPVTPPLITTPSRSLRGDVIPKDVPIVFDILSIGEESQTSTEARRNAKGGGGSTSSEEKDEVDRIYSVRFLGCMGVNVDTGQTVVFEVMRRILAARAIHDMFTTSHLHLTVTATHLTLRDPSSKAVRLQHRLKDVSFWAVHSENQRLVGYIVRQSDSSSGPSSKEGTFSCYVFESDEGGRDICAALGAAARQAYAHLLDQKTREQKRKEETKLLLDNIAKLPDKTSPSETSSDGSALVIERDSRKTEEEEDKREDNVAEATESSSSKQEKKKVESDA